MKRNIYLNMQSRKNAQNIFWSHFTSLTTHTETIPVKDSCGRITAAPIIARLSAPSFHSAAMDGIAVVAADTFIAADDNPVSLDIAGGQAALINTGHPLPPDKNAVIMVENILLDSDNTTAVIREPVFPWQHVRKVGEDIVATELLFPTGHQIQPADIAAMITAGCTTVEVRRKPVITIIPTGSELIPLTDSVQTPPPGKTIESNSAVLAGLAEKAGATVRVTDIVADDYETLKNHIQSLLETDTDMLVVNAGSSAGSADYTAQIIDDLGEILVHGVTIMPGKPTILATVTNKPVVGIPGYPVSAIIAFEQFVMPLLAQMQGITLPEPVCVPAILAKDIPSQSGIEEFRRMITGKIGDSYVAVPLKKGSGAITTLTRANAMLHIDAASEGESRGSLAELELLQPKQAIERTILSTGSHDLSLDLLRDSLQQHNPAYYLASTHVGSLGGIMAMQKSMTHIAGSHLLDPESGTYNTAFINKYLADRKISLFTLAHRQQGFIIKKGNPKAIQTISDLVRDDVTFINRQAGSGTRVLLDYELDKNDIDSDDIQGYDHDEYTHMAVAVAVLSGKADMGLGIMSAAKALELDFIPVTEERYDLLIDEAYLELPMIQTLLAIINSEPFQQTLESMGGYSTRETGQLVQI
ncbi:molybdopterin biosynthesis protein [Desulfogranum marinum]|uniref:molybdopterin biosynthesis protein n=1 Tax=Desulfogranum marinum TaxID=453220 RepID=UPI0019640700|nr:molybdopterin biosynthesis protein [Desulfogranum marinum]MBM9514304.1 molybdopterin biosynthesis protein [Desulfogranum marinum]